MTDLELRELLSAGMTDILRLQRYLNRASDHLHEFPTPFDEVVWIDGANQNVEGARANLDKAHDTVDDVRDRILEYVGLIKRMAEQRQSAAEAYEAGYNARLADLMAQLSASEYSALRQALVELDDEDIPF